jgi:hypothetical protein
VKDDFDPSRFRVEITPEQRAALAPSTRKVPRITPANRRRRNLFIKVPDFWVDRLLTAKHAATLKLALHLLTKRFESWTKDKQFTLANGVLEEKFGISRWVKWRALAELEQLGLIWIERRRRRSPLITVRIREEGT